jgi:signal transduction histidine kinase
MHATKEASPVRDGVGGAILAPAASLELGPVRRRSGQRPDTGHPAGRLERALGLLPHGDKLGDEAFARRHRLGQWSLAIVSAILLLVGSANNWAGELDHLALDMSPMLVAGLLAWWAPNRMVAALSVAFGLMAASANLVHLTGGLIEAHFLFFVLLPLVALYQDWLVFLGSIGFVLVHHTVIGTMAPELVYNHPAAQERPVLWGAIHALFVVGLVLVLLAEWAMAEHQQRQLRQAVTDLTNAQEELVGAQKMESVGQLAAGIAHEINTPMQYIGDNTYFLKASVQQLLQVADVAAASLEEARAEGPLNAEQERLAAMLAGKRLTLLRERAPKAADDALSGVENVTRIVRAMRRFSHPGDDAAELVDVNESITTTTIVCRNEWKYAAELETHLDPDLPLIEGFLGPLNQVWLNMIVNASHAIAEHRPGAKGLIDVTTRSLPHAGSIEVAIGDDGCGIAPDNLRRIFDHFFTTKEVGRGTGQGLSMVYQVIVNDHHGTINVESTLGGGTRFTVTLPVAKPETASETTKV